MRARLNWRMRGLLAAFGAGAILTGCGPPPVLLQMVPVSSTPLGATVYADGQFAGTTPLSLTLARNRDNLVTVTQPGYRAANIPVQRQYLAGDVMMRSMQAGAHMASFFNDPARGVSAASDSVQSDQESGAAYQLVPPVIVVTMVPAGGGARSEGTARYPGGGAAGRP